MKRLAVVFMSALFGLGAVNAYAATGIYISGTLGYSSYKAKNVEYVASGLYSGRSSEPDVSDSGFLYGLGLGYDFAVKTSIPIRLELVFTGRPKSPEVSDQPPYGEAYSLGSINTLMLNGWFDFPLEGMVKPYLGVGVGAGFVDYKYANGTINLGVLGSYPQGGTSGSTFAPALGLGLGARINVTERFSVDLGYRFTSLSGCEADFLGAGASNNRGLFSSLEFDTQAHDLLLSLHVKF